MFRRILGLIMVLIGLSGVYVGVIGSRAAGDVVDSVGMGLAVNLDLVSQSLDAVEETLILAKASIADVGTGLDTVETTANDIGTAINETKPLLDQIRDIVSDEVPTSVEAVEAALPNIANVAGAIDNTLTTLNNFAIDESFDIPNPFSNDPLYTFELQYDLGINYDPTIPFEQTVEDLGGTIENLPGRLRSLAVYINVSKNNLDTISQNVFAISDDLAVINGRIAEIDPLLDEYTRIVVELNDQSRLIKNGISDQLESIKRTINIVMIWFVLTQVAPIYLGWELLSGRRIAEVRKLKEAVEDLQEVVEENV